MNFNSISCAIQFFAIALLIFSDVIIAGTDGATPQLVEPPVPSAFVMKRDGNTSQGDIESMDGKVTILRLSEGGISWEVKLMWSDDQLVSIDKRGENPKLDRSTHTHVVIENSLDGRIQAQHIHANGMKLYEIRYHYDSFELPQRATVTAGNGQVIEQLCYEYGDTAWAKPIYLFQGLHFGQVRTYSHYPTKEDEKFLFTVADYEEEDWRIESLTFLGSTGIPGEVQEFTYGKPTVSRNRVSPEKKENEKWVAP